MVKAVPEGFRTVTAGLCVSPCDQAIAFYEKAFGATTRSRMTMKGKIGHAELKIGDSIIFLSDEFPEMPGCRAPRTLEGTTGGLYLYVPDVDAACDRAVKAGAKVLMPVADMFWGDRYGQVQDPFGHIWGLSTHKEDLTPEQMAQRQQAFFATAGKPGDSH